MSRRRWSRVGRRPGATRQPCRLEIRLYWEGFVIEQVLRELSVRARRFEPYFFRTSDGHEIDLVLDLGSERWAVDIKLTASPTLADLERLDKTGAMIKATRRFLVPQTPRSSGDAERASCNLAGLIERLGE